MTNATKTSGPATFMYSKGYEPLPKSLIYPLVRVIFQYVVVLHTTPPSLPSKNCSCHRKTPTKRSPLYTTALANEAYHICVSSMSYKLYKYSVIGKTFYFIIRVFVLQLNTTWWRHTMNTYLWSWCNLHETVIFHCAVQNAKNPFTITYLATCQWT